MKKVKKVKKIKPHIDLPRPALNPTTKRKGGLFVHVQSKRSKENALLAWRIKEAEENR